MAQDATAAESASGARVQAGSLYVVSTPIGNRGDFSPRAREVLATVDRICVEDTRVSGPLLSDFGIRKPLQPLHEHNETQIVPGLVEALRGGATLALISDAGTPLVSDPGYALVAAVRAAGLPVFAVPGPSALLAALAVSGLPTDRFVFEGFLPAKPAARRARLQQLATESRTLVVYESSHRIAGCVDDVAAVFGARRVCLARELTKRFEESVQVEASALPQWIAADANRTRGEFVLVIEGAPAAAAEMAEGERVLRILLKALPASGAARVAAALTALPRRALYDRALTLADNALPDAEDE